MDYWFNNRCERGVSSSILIQELYNNYVHYCQCHAATAVRVTEFTKLFPISAALCKHIRVYKRRAGKGTCFVGVRLKQKIP